MTERTELLKRYISDPVRELDLEWFYIDSHYPTWLHICKPHFWKELEADHDPIFEDTWAKFTDISCSRCRRCLTPVPDHLVKLIKLLSLGKEIS